MRRYERACGQSKDVYVYSINKNSPDGPTSIYYIDEVNSKKR